MPRFSICSIWHCCIEFSMSMYYSIKVTKAVTGKAGKKKTRTGTSKEYISFQVRPTCFLGVPRVWEKIYERMQEAGAQVGGVKKAVATWAKYHGLNYFNALRDGR